MPQEGFESPCNTQTAGLRWDAMAMLLGPIIWQALHILVAPLCQTGRGCLYLAVRAIEQFAMSAPDVDHAFNDPRHCQSEMRSLVDS